jgi:mannose-6-phosphate isomerase-like protein (cupin superfamily)
MQARQLPATPDVTAPDGSDVRILCGLRGGSMAHFSLAPGKVSKAVMHRTVEEIWYIVAGEGEMWRADSRQETVIALTPGLSLTIPVGTSFQFRSTGPSALEAVAITMPPWPGEDEAVLVKGVW